ncbi:serine/threonine-protein phosphatase 2A activator-like [Contarinia nasturtii]|uniref:serine/threonine-protein phosphatase 2A activator-like n=1 Tax=Contarinia nasturtii TaxID=265458 RepID=UPI0012D47C1F|nr:serine/threonine-protein phosphatase 2A activator-like [Contarinia nasturtii]
MNDMAIREKSTAYYDIISFISRINRAVRGKKLSTKLNPSPIADDLLHIFDDLNKMIDETPSTFGDWFEKMKRTSTGLLEEALPVVFQHALIEVSTYFIESFGNATRNDYGTGHELAFIMFLCALYKIHALTERDNLYVGLKIFNAYLQLVRRLQLTYGMGLAGSHGVSSMDDDQYVHVQFIWGSAQLSVKEPFEPKCFLEIDVNNRYKNEYYFIGYIDHIVRVKTGSFAEHSKQLSSLCSVDSWEIINSILIEKYENELLAKFPVIQHLLLGSVLKLKEISDHQKEIDRQKVFQVILDQVITDHLSKSTPIWEMISSQLRWTTISNKILKLISGRKH